MALSTFRGGFREGTFPELSGRDFDAYLAAGVLTAKELATIGPVAAVVLRTKLRHTILGSAEIKKILRDSIEADLEALEDQDIAS